MKFSLASLLLTLAAIAITLALVGWLPYGPVLALWWVALCIGTVGLVKSRAMPVIFALVLAVAPTVPVYLMATNHMTNKLRKIRPGARSAMVRQILGSPSEVTPIQAGESWDYTHLAWYPVTIRIDEAGRVTDVKQEY